MPTLSVVVVAHDSRRRSRGRCPRSPRELRDGDELIVVDNASGDGTAEAVRGAGARRERDRDRAPTSASRAGCNRGAAARAASCSCSSTPTRRRQPGFRDAIEPPARRRARLGRLAGRSSPRTAARDRSTPRGGVVHFTGIAWAGGARRARSTAAPPAPSRRSRLRLRRLPRDPARSASRSSAASPSDFFLYHEDVDLSLRLRLARRHARGRAGARASTTTTSSTRAPAKWRCLERNRWATLDPRPTRRSLLVAAGAGAARDRARAARGRRSPAAGCRRSCAPGATSLGALPRLLARAPRDPGGADGQRRASSPRGSPPTSTPPTSARAGRSRAACAQPFAPTGGSCSACSARR